MSYEQKIKTLRVERQELVDSLENHIEDQEKFDQTKSLIDTKDSLIARYEELESEYGQTAKPVEETKSFSAPAIHVKSKPEVVDDGLDFARHAIAFSATKGNPSHITELFREYAPQSKALTTAGNETSTLVNISNTGDMIKLLQPYVAYPKMQGWKKGRFNEKKFIRTEGATARFTGEGQRKHQTTASYSGVVVKKGKITSLLPVTDEVVAMSDIDLLTDLQQSMLQGIGECIDNVMFDEQQTESDEVPAGITNGADVVAATGTNVEDYARDVQALVDLFDNYRVETDGAYLVMSRSRANKLSFLQNALGAPAFPGMGSGIVLQAGTSRTLFGFPVVISSSVQDKIVLVQPSLIVVADQGGIEMKMSGEASITGTDGNMISAYENNLQILRAEKFISWKKAHPRAVAYIDYSTGGGASN